MIAVVNNFHPFSGIGKHSFNLLKALNMRTEAEMVYLESKDNRIEKNFPKAKKIVQEKPYPFLNKTLSWYYFFPKRIPKGYGIYHASSQYLGRIAEFCSPAVISHFDLAPIVFPQEHPFLLRHFLKKAVSHYPKAEKILCHSEKRKTELLDFGIRGLDESKVVFSPLGIDLENFFKVEKEKARKELGLPLGKKIILNVGVEEDRKGTHVLLKGVKELQERNPDAVLVRVGNKNKKFDGQKKGLNIMHFSNIAEEKMKLFYSSADVFVFPTLYEGWGYPPIEAMACSCPVIVSDEMDFLSEGSIVIKKENTEGIIKNCEKIFHNDSFSKKCSEKARNEAENFSLEKEAESMLKIYGGIIDGKKGL